MLDKTYCKDCDDDFYNDKNPLGVKECWSLQSAKLVKKYCIGWWTPTDRKENFTVVEVPNCYRRNGKFAYLDELPEHLR